MTNYLIALSDDSYVSEGNGAVCVYSTYTEAYETMLDGNYDGNVVPAGMEDGSPARPQE